jgi:histidine ammonia-lyase
MPQSLVLDGSSLSLAQLANAARDPSITVELSASAWESVDRAAGLVAKIRATYEALPADADAETRRLSLAYGTTTGFGEFKKVAVAPDQLDQLQVNILISHAAGVGDNENPDDLSNYFPPDVVRAALIIRVNTFLRGHSGLRHELVEAVVRMINRGIIPLVPTRGSLGSSGDLCPLAHLFLPILGLGRFYVVSDAGQVATRGGEKLRDGSEFAAAMGLSAAQAAVLHPRVKEGLALTNGATFSAAMLALASHDARELADTSDAAAALTLESVCGRTRALHPAIHEARGMTGQARSAAVIRAMIRDSRLVDRTSEVQDVYSLRCAPQVHGASRDAIEYAADIAAREINAATDNPLFFPKMTDVAGRVGAGREELNRHGLEVNRAHEPHAFSAGNFHGQPVAIASDVLAIAVAELANVSERRLQMLLDEYHNRGLPPNLTANPGLHSGFMIAQYSAASLVSENKILCHPASVDSIPSSANTEDHVAMATTAARKVRTVLANTRAVVATELLVAAQAAEWRVGDPRRAAPAKGGEADHLPDFAIERHPDDRPPVLNTPQEIREAMELRRAAFNVYKAAGRFSPEMKRTDSTVGRRLGAGSWEAYKTVRMHAAAMLDDEVLSEPMRAVRAAVVRGEFAKIVRSLA